jgi:hypothetical protein
MFNLTHPWKNLQPKLPNIQFSYWRKNETSNQDCRELVWRDCRYRQFGTWIFPNPARQFPVGYFSNDFSSIMVYGLLLILIRLPLSFHTGYARNALA